ncbi:glycosyltransferase family 4 protein [Lewinella sp. IMCC34191]|uniref:glycosyltransferase family 4 protein n=1 Tax=Lewinella sp. IMCC34191 TaxID=2259172 RepID=UPI000E2382EA|nr:glycosyltransferase family 4 protein [Lewinella sp. IMCC34191]
MKILISTPVFKPMVGGMETLANNFAVHFTERGHDVTLVTPIPYDGVDDEPYRIVRQPSFSEFYRLAKHTDIIFSNGASLYAAPHVLLTGKPIIMRHTGYQVACIDGAGWYDGKLAPLRPIPSFRFHLKHGKLGNTLRGIAKVTALRTFAKRFVTVNVAISDWMMRQHPLPNQLRIHNPFPISKFVGGRNTSGEYAYDFFFLGRLVTEKGVNLLVEAFATVQERAGNRYRLCIIGDGPERPRLEKMVREAGQSNFVTFTGMLTKDKLVNQMKECKIAVLPSTWEEPFGGAASEILAAGKNVIVSRDGALSEIVAEAGLTFPNNDSQALADAMQRLIEDEQLQEEHRRNAVVRLEAFNEDELIDEYLTLFNRVLAEN